MMVWDQRHLLMLIRSDYLFSRVMWWLLNEAHEVVREVLGVTYVMMEVNIATRERVVLQKRNMMGVLLLLS